MKIFNISSILPLKGLDRENDIVVRVQSYLKANHNYQFILAKSIPYVPKILSKVSTKWRVYYNYQNIDKIDVQGFDTYIYPWILPPTSSFWINYLLVPINLIWFHLVVKNKLLNQASKADLLVSQNLVPDAFVAYWLSKSLNKPFIINLRGDSKILWFRLPFLKRIIQSSDAIITHSPTNYEKFKDNYEVKLIPHPVDEIFFNVATRNNIHAKIISVCRLLKLKNLELVLKSLSVLKRDGYKFDYNIVGDGPEFEILNDLVCKLNLTSEVKFLGFLDRYSVVKLMHESDIFVMPSYPETLGRVFLEAAAAGCLIIGHKKTGVDGIFEHEVSAYFVDKDNLINYLRESIVSKGNVDFTQIVEKGVQRVQNLNWNGIGMMYNDIYKRLV